MQVFFQRDQKRNDNVDCHLGSWYIQLTVIVLAHNVMFLVCVALKFLFLLFAVSCVLTCEAYDFSLLGFWSLQCSFLGLLSLTFFFVFGLWNGKCSVLVYAAQSVLFVYVFLSQTKKKMMDLYFTLSDVR